MAADLHPPPAFVAELARHAARIAVAGEDLRLTYADLAARVAERRAALGDGRRLVMLAGGNHLELLVTYLAALSGGHVAWLVPDLARAARMRQLITPDVLVGVEAGGELRVEACAGPPAHALHPELALLMGTSGSTGAPRLVRLSRANLDANAGAVAASLGIGADERAITSLPLHYCYGLSVVHSHLLRGAGLVLTGRSVTDPAFWELARAEGATSFAGVPHTFELLERTGRAEPPLPTLRYVTQAGGRMAPERVRRWAETGGRRGWRLVVMYGQTEATARMAYLPSALARHHPGAIGVPVPGGSIVLEPVPEAPAPDVGELVYRGPNVMLGYAERPADLARGREVVELRTGDLGRRTVDGLLEVVGRRSRVVKVVGLRVDLDEVERRAAAMGAPALVAGTDDDLVVAVTAPVPPPPGMTAALAADLGVPAARVRVVHLPEPPRLANGKPDYPAIAERARRDVSAPPPAPDLERAVAAVLSEALGRPEVGPGDSFTALGGDSLSYVDASLGLEEVLGGLPPDWPERPVRELAALVRPPGRTGRMETSVALRAAAVTLVVASHMTAFWPAGGAHLLLGLAGHSFGRFQLAAGRRAGDLAASIGRIALPAALWAALVAVLGGVYGPANVLLVTTLVGDADVSSGRWQLWFVEVLVQILAALGALMAVPRLRRLDARRPLLVPLALLVPALAVRHMATAAGDPARFFRPHLVVWVFLLGWAVARARRVRERVAVSVAVVGATAGAFGDPVREAVVAGGLLLVLWVPTLRVPRPAARVAGAVAAASLWVYLTQWQAWPAAERVLPTGLAIPVTIAAGVAAAALAARASAGWARALRRVREHGRGGPLVGHDADALTGREELVRG